MALRSPKVHFIEYHGLSDVSGNKDPLLNTFNTFLKPLKDNLLKGDLIRSQQNCYRNSCLFIWNGEQAVIPYNSWPGNNYGESFDGEVEPDEYGYLPDTFDALEYDVWNNNWWNIPGGIAHNFFFYTNLSSYQEELKRNLSFKRFDDDNIMAVTWFNHLVHGEIAIVYQNDEPFETDDTDYLEGCILDCFKENNFYSFYNYDLIEDIQDYIDEHHHKQYIFMTERVLNVAREKRLRMVR